MASPTAEGRESKVKARYSFLPVLAVVMAILLSSGTAQAQSGGGCRDTGGVGSCISYFPATGRLVADFYLNRPPDSSVCFAWLKIIKTSSDPDVQLVAQRFPSSGMFTRQGRYGPISVGAGAPSSAAIAQVDIYRCDNHLHFVANSWTIYYP
jgi:hypothetical protein